MNTILLSAQAAAQGNGGFGSNICCNVAFYVSPTTKATEENT